MPVPKRYFHCSQELNFDSELWEFTTLFGDRSIRTWMQVLAYLDKSQNCWRLSGDWLGTLSRTVRQSSANCSRQVRHMVEKGWLLVRETSADGSPLVLEGRNWLKYNRRQELKRDSLVPDKGLDRDPLLSFPTPTPTPTPTPIPKEKEKEKEKSSACQVSKKPSKLPPLSDEEWFKIIQTNPAYNHINFEREFGKMDAWLSLPANQHRKKTRRFILKWLNRIESPVAKPPITPSSGSYHKKVVL